MDKSADLEFIVACLLLAAVGVAITAYSEWRKRRRQVTAFQRLHSSADLLAALYYRWPSVSWGIITTKMPALVTIVYRGGPLPEDVQKHVRPGLPTGVRLNIDRLTTWWDRALDSIL